MLRESQSSSITKECAGQRLAMSVLLVSMFAACTASPDFGRGGDETKGSRDPRDEVVQEGQGHWSPAPLSEHAPLAGAGAHPDDSTDLSREELARPSWEEFVASARVPGSDEYLVEVDIPFFSEADLRDYYDGLDRDGSEKSVVDLVGGVRNVRGSAQLIGYCFSGGWGAAQGNCSTDGLDNDGDTIKDEAGEPCYTAPALAAVRTNIQAAMRLWEAVANVRFVYQSSKDGATCTNAGAQPAGVSFTVTHWNGGSPTGGGIATGPFPNLTWANQFLRVPPPGISSSLALHELGHAMGLRHEHVHSMSGLSDHDGVKEAGEGFCEEGSSAEDLTPFDALSAMAYANCATSQSIVGAAIPTQNDGVGMRALYGMPAAWYIPVFEI